MEETLGVPDIKSGPISARITEKCPAFCEPNFHLSVLNLNTCEEDRLVTYSSIFPVKNPNQHPLVSLGDIWDLGLSQCRTVTRSRCPGATPVKQSTSLACQKSHLHYDANRRRLDFFKNWQKLVFSPTKMCFQEITKDVHFKENGGAAKLIKDFTH